MYTLDGFDRDTLDRTSGGLGEFIPASGEFMTVADANERGGFDFLATQQSSGSGTIFGNFLKRYEGILSNSVETFIQSKLNPRQTPPAIATTQPVFIVQPTPAPIATKPALIGGAAALAIAGVGVALLLRK